MKISRESEEFKPLTIVLETEKEFEVFVEAAKYALSEDVLTLSSDTVLKNFLDEVGEKDHAW